MLGGAVEAVARRWGMGGGSCHFVRIAGGGFCVGLRRMRFGVRQLGGVEVRSRLLLPESLILRSVRGNTFTPCCSNAAMRRFVVFLFFVWWRGSDMHVLGAETRKVLARHGRKDPLGVASIDRGIILGHMNSSHLTCTPPRN